MDLTVGVMRAVFFAAVAFFPCGLEGTESIGLPEALCASASVTLARQFWSKHIGRDTRVEGGGAFVLAGMCWG